MVAFTYSRVIAANYNTTPPTVAKSATGSVYAIADTTFTTPLNLTLVVGGVTTTSISADSSGIFPDFTVNDRTSVVWKQAGSPFSTVLTTTDPVPGPKGDPGNSGSKGDKGDRGDLAAWQPTTFYPLNQVISDPLGNLVRVTTAHTSAGSYDATKFEYAVPPTLTPAALNATYGPTASPMKEAFAASSTLGIFPGRKIGFIGDSHTQFSPAIGPTNGNYGYARHTLHHLGSYYGSLATSVIDGVAGERSDQIALRLDAMLAQGINLLVLWAGANDSNQLVTLTTFRANMTAMVTKAKSKGVPVVIVGVPPKEASVAGLNASMRQAVDSYNTWLSQWCPANGVEFADIWPKLASATTGDLNPTYANTGNGHINDGGHWVIAVEVAAAVERAQKSTPKPAGMQRPSNLVANGFMSGAGVIPDGWSILVGESAGAGATLAIVNDSTGLLPGGRWFQADANNIGGTSNMTKVYTHNLTGSFEVGDKLAVTGHLMVEDLTGGWVTGIQTHAQTTGWSLGLRFNGTNATTLDDAAGVPLGSNRYYLGPIWATASATTKTAPMARFRFSAPIGQRFKFHVGGVEVLNLTAMGLTTEMA